MHRLRAATAAAPMLLLVACVVSPGPDAASAGDPTPPASSAASAPAASDHATSPPASGTAAPDPSPSPSLDPSTLELDVTSCNGGVVLQWSASTDPRFHHYTALRSPEREIAPDYPPIAPAVDWGDTYATDRFVTSAVDASIIPSTTRWFYRVMAYDADGAVIGASPVVAGTLHEVEDLGAASADPTSDGRTVVRWRPYGGFSACFSHYRILSGPGGAPMSVLAIVSDQAASELRTDAFRAGTAYRIRVEAVRTTTLGSFVVGASETATYSAP